MPLKKKLRVLIVEDEEDQAFLMARQLEAYNGFDVEWKRVDTEAAMIDALNRFPFDMVWLDYKMPTLSAERALQIKKEKKIAIPFILLSGTVDNRLANEMIRQGAKKYVNKDILAELLPVVEDVFELADERDGLIDMLGGMLEERDWETGGHSERVTNLSVEFARYMGISETEIIHIRRGALLHDLGKFFISDSILLKRRDLMPGERMEMQRHPELAKKILQSRPFLRPAIDIPYCHHEKVNGTGYPRGLKGDEIPLAARLFSIVDTYDALTSDRPYREAWSKERALQHIRLEKSISFDPVIADQFIEMMESRE